MEGRLRWVERRRGREGDGFPEGVREGLEGRAGESSSKVNLPWPEVLPRVGYR